LVNEHGRNGAEVTLWTVGKKAPSYFRYRGIAVERSFPGIADRPEFVDARSIAATVTGPFVAGEMDIVQLVSTRFISAGTQRVEMQQMLPLPLPEEDDEVPAPSTELVGYTEFEPEPEKLLAELAPRAAEAEIFAALLEGAASFFTAQQRAMAAATDNADELVRTLTRVMNRARQDAITTEIMEIVGGAEALRQAKGA
jgi:F-type H+-transporting ATPase subunit gamma